MRSECVRMQNDTRATNQVGLERNPAREPPRDSQKCLEVRATCVVSRGDCSVAMTDVMAGDRGGAAACAIVGGLRWLAKPFACGSWTSNSGATTSRSTRCSRRPGSPAAAARRPNKMIFRLVKTARRRSPFAIRSRASAPPVRNTRSTSIGKASSPKKAPSIAISFTSPAPISTPSSTNT